MEMLNDLFYEYNSLFSLGIALASLVFGFFGFPLFLWTALAAFTLLFVGASSEVWIGFGVIAGIFNLFPIRQVLLSLPIMKVLQAAKILPHISETERTALNSGGVWVEQEFFNGRPRWNRFRKSLYPKLTAEEQAFLDGPCEELCTMVDDWKVWQDKDLSPETWAYIKKKGFLGMIIPKEYGGLGFSATAHSEVIHKLASRSVTLCISVMVPNSLGPAELLNHYGTPEQKKEYLPKLASGEFLPCFALTEPGAGSDAGAIQSHGTVFKGDDGKLYLRLNWKKRWITLAAVSQVLGLAFRLYDPDKLLGGKKDVGITCALIPTHLDGVKLGRRHDPLGVPFYNCPTDGKDVVVPVEAIIGGQANAGKGWKMLMESLAAGRGISLPAESVGLSKLVLKATSAHSVVRKQFGMSIGKFEGIEEPLARIGGFNYLLDAARLFTLGGIDSGEKPPVVTAIAKYNFTELSRIIINDAMDIVGGAAISRGPRNVLAHPYMATPIAITVEGANILTRTLIIFGQGALRAHPFAYKVVSSIEDGNAKAFDRAFWSHLGIIFRNFVRVILLYPFRGLIAIPPVYNSTTRYYQRLSWASAVFAFMTDMAMGMLGGKLKLREKITGRFADALSWMYLATTVLQRFEKDGYKAEDKIFVDWAMEYSFHRIHVAFDGIFANFEGPLGSGIPFRTLIRFLHNLNPMGKAPSDALGGKIARAIQIPGQLRDRHTTNIFIPKDGEGLSRYETTLATVIEAEAAIKKLRKGARKQGVNLKQRPADLIKEALEKNIISSAEADLIARAEEARNDTIQVDEYELEEYKAYATGASSGPRDSKSASA